MKKPFFLPPVEFETKPSVPDDPEQAARLIADLMDNVESAKLRSSQAQAIQDQGTHIRLLSLIRGKKPSKIPPSQDRLSGKAKRQSHRKPSNKKRGAQPGHIRNTRQVVPESEVDQIERHFPDTRCS